MKLEKELLNILNDDGEPLTKKLKLANNAFRSSELPLQHKEALLLYWLINKIDNNAEETWKLLNEWLKSNHFHELSRNDINNEEITKIIQALLEKLKQYSKGDNATACIITDSVKIFIENHTIQQYFKYNIATYLELIVQILESVDEPTILKEFLNKNIFYKSLITSENFLKSFLEILIPGFVKCCIRNEDLFNTFSVIIQKCLFYNNRKAFGIYMSQFFGGKKEGTQPVPNLFFKYLLQIYKTEKKSSPVYFKLLFHAFSTAYEVNVELIYQFVILTIQIIGFNLNEILIFFKISKLVIPEADLSLNQSQEILLAVLDVLTDIKTDMKCTIKEVCFSDFLKNLLIEVLQFNSPSVTSYKIIIKILAIEPLLVQSLTEETIRYAMLADNTGCSKEYNDLIISIFDTYLRLHRIESLVSKMVEALSSGLHVPNTPIKPLYVFRGKIDITENEIKSEYEVGKILTKEILDCFNKCICHLASWQVINVFKTLLHFLNQVLENIDNTENENLQHCIFVQILSELISTFLCSIRIAEHTVASNVIDKCVKCLDDLRDSLKVFGSALVQREHNHSLMRSFLNIAYYWAEINITLKHYSLISESYHGVIDNNFSCCNISYTHPYLNDREWCLLSERITNFGEAPCKRLLHKMYLQKLRCLYLFNNTFNEDIKNDIVRTIASYSRDNWKIVLEDKVVVDFLLPEMDTVSVTNVAENLVKVLEKREKYEIPNHVLNSPILLTAVNGVVLMKLNKVISKRKHSHKPESVFKPLSAEIFALIPDDVLSIEDDYVEVIYKMRDIYNMKNGEQKKQKFEWKMGEEKICRLLRLSKVFPIVFSHIGAQKIFLIYLLSLHNDLSNEFSEGNYAKLQSELELFIFGILQQCKFKLSDIFDINKLNSDILENFKNWEQIFTLVNENVFKHENFTEYYDKFVEKVIKNLSELTYMRSAIIIMNNVNKLKKTTRVSKEIKNIADTYKTKICIEISQLLKKHEPGKSLLIGYAYALRHFFSQNDDEKISSLLEHLRSYVNFALKHPPNFDSIGYLTLFITVLQNKSKIAVIEEDYVMKFWCACTENLTAFSGFEEYSQLVVLIVGHVSNEVFPDLMKDLLAMSENAILKKELSLFGTHLKTWESVISCNLNPIKTKILQNCLETLLQQIIMFLESFDVHETMFENVFEFEKTLVQIKQLHLTPAIIDLLLISITILITKESVDFNLMYCLSTSIMVSLLKQRKSLIMDRLPPFLQEYRLILKKLCKKSNSDLNLDELEVRQLADCAQLLEKLTRTLVGFPKDMGRIAMYLIADILNQYEQVTLYPNVKMHLNNCLYSLISVCDQHAINYLLRVLSTASTEIFKLMYDNYKKYYRFTGKV